MNTRSIRPRLAVLAVLPVLALVAACGEGGGGKADGIAEAPETTTASAGSPAPTTAGPGNGGKSAFYDAQLTYVRCMRTKGGVKEFPDPKLSGHLDWSRIAEIADPSGHGEEQKGGRNGVCAPEMMAAMNLEPKRDAQKDFESMLAHAKCMRENGVSRFTNPTMSHGNVLPGGEPDPVNPSLDRGSAAYKQARQACKDKLLDGLDGMQ
ncbi:hypothetical protein ACFU7Y_36050 [Kitasatospora sp. NPDC057542]|uniref:hypothetical protein n=1 Tax=Streptomycetaceae TaxID=2062 RepID=UPI001CCCD412|nr:hypothetical protein [Streptomyces sp. LS1784]